jgi:hypothetical protein
MKAGCFKMRKRLITVAIVLGTTAVLVSGWTAYSKWKYPYGWSHCCIIGMKSSLEFYAEEHGGRYPAGESSPEASLSLLYRSNYMDAYTLRGMTVPETTVRRILEGGGLLGPDSCGWQYVEGLTQADDPGIAILYCKHALGHNGQRTKDGGRQVAFVGSGGIEWISGDKWPTFLKEQGQLLLARNERARVGMPLVTGVIELPDGTRLNLLEGAYTMTEESGGPNGSGSGRSSGSAMSRSELVWYQARLKDGYVTRTLSFSNLISDPVTITFTNGVPDVTNFVFRMKVKG